MEYSECLLTLSNPLRWLSGPVSPRLKMDDYDAAEPLFCRAQRGG
jgi:hypothetical protein